ncbi:MAG: HD-GYP domain-containing protein [Deferrisomatales bacterium]
MKILIVDAQLAGRVILERLALQLETTSWIEVAADAACALERAGEVAPDLVLLDIGLGHEAAVRLVRALRDRAGCAEIPVVAVAGADERPALHAVLDAGASDYLLRPVDPTEFRVRCRNLLLLLRQQRLLENRAEWLSRRVKEATEAIRAREVDTLLRLAKAGEHRDEDTGGHVLRMARYSRIIAETMGLGEEECHVLELAAPLHDIGKIGVSDSILLQPRRLTPPEFDSLKRHTTIGYEILRGSPSKYVQAGASIALCHHERVDGSGYPGGLCGSDIPLRARIVAVADVYDALRVARPYKGAWSHAEALTEIVRNAGTQFDRQCVEAFRWAEPRILEVARDLACPGQETLTQEINLKGLGELEARESELG